MQKALFLLMMVLCACPAFAQPSLGEAAAQNRAAADAKKAAAAPPTRQEVIKLFEVMQIEKSMDAVIDATKKQSGEMAEQMLRDRLPEVTPEQKKNFQTMVDNVMRKALGPEAIHEMFEATVPVYQKHLSKADVDGMIAFYSSPVGQKILREQPAMVQESMMATAGIQQKIARTMFQKIDEEMEKMADAAKQPPKSN